MVKFVERANEDAFNATGASRGVIPDKSLGTLFSGLGGAIKAGATAIDENIQNRIRSEAEDTVDKVNDEFGVGDFAKVSQNQTVGDRPGSTAIPTEIESSAKALGNLNTAVKQGKISRTTFFGRIEAKIRELRARYPGHRQEIDKIVADVMNQPAANQIREGLIREAEANATAGAKRANKIFSFILQNSEFAPPDFFDDPEKYQGREGQVVANIQKQLTQRERLKFNMTQAEARAKFNDLNKEDAKKIATQNANIIFDSALQQTIDSNPTEFGNFNTTVSGAQATEGPGGATITPEEDEAIRQSFFQWKQTVLKGVSDHLNAQTVGDTEFSFASHIGESGVSEINNLIAGRIAIIENAVLSKDFGILEAQSRMLKKIAEDDKFKALSGSDGNFWRRFGLLKQLAGPEGLAIALSKSGEFQSEFQKAIHTLTFAEATTGVGNKTIDEAIRRAIDNESNSGEVKALIKGAVDALTNEQASPEAVKNAARFLFDPSNNGFLNNFGNSQSKRQAFSQLVSADVTKRMAKVRQTDPDAWQNYVNWALDKFKVFAKFDIDTVQEARTSSDQFGVQYNPNTNQFALTRPSTLDQALSSSADDLALGPAGVARLGLTAIREGIEAIKNSAFQKSVNSLNAYIKTIEPILKEQGMTNDDIAKTVGALLTEAGNDPSTENEGSAFKRLRDAIREKFEGGSSGERADEEAAPIFDTISGLFGNSEAELELTGGNETVSTNLGGTEKGVLDIIGQAEAVRQDGANGYNSLFPATFDPKISKMTIAEVQKFQRKRISQGFESSAIGRYQFIQKTLDRMIKKEGLSPTTRFSPEIQDRLALALIEEQGLQDFKDGKISKQTFANRLAGQWAGLPIVSGTNKGKSKFKGIGSNKATIDVDTFLAALVGKGSPEGKEPFVIDDLGTPAEVKEASPELQKKFQDLMSEIKENRKRTLDKRTEKQKTP